MGIFGTGWPQSPPFADISPRPPIQKRGKTAVTARWGCAGGGLWLWLPGAGAGRRPSSCSPRLSPCHRRHRNGGLPGAPGVFVRLGKGIPQVADHGQHLVDGGVVLVEVGVHQPPDKVIVQGAQAAGDLVLGVQGLVALVGSDVDVMQVKPGPLKGGI